MHFIGQGSKKYAVEKYQRPTILLLNTDGLTKSKIEVLERLAIKNEVLVIPLQEICFYTGSNEIMFSYHKYRLGEICTFSCTLYHQIRLKKVILVYYLILAVSENTQRGRDYAQGMGSNLDNLFSQSVQKMMQMVRHFPKILFDCPYCRQNSGLRRKFAIGLVPA